MNELNTIELTKSDDEDPILDSLKLRALSEFHGDNAISTREEQESETLQQTEGTCNEIVSMKSIGISTPNHEHSETGKKSKSYCALHHDEEIVFACYQCQKMCCQKCKVNHKGHSLAFFKDDFIYNNYENVDKVNLETLQENPQIQLQMPKNEQQSPNFELYLANVALTKDRVQIKVIKDFKNKDNSF